ncbi:MAG: amidohydrolase [Desulfatirhabdiaceae bacterium]
MRDLTVSLIQTDLVWENSEANLTLMEEWIARLDMRTDLIVLPEMFNTGFTMNAAELAQTMDGPAVTWLKQTALQNDCHVIGSVIVMDDGRYFNRLICAGPDGNVMTYDKRHLFRMMEEDRVYTAGTSRLTVDIDGWRIRPFICYDLRFPIWTRNLDNAYDVAIFIANWPQKRAHHWNSLLVARAIENQCYVIGVNRVGRDGNGLRFSGDSAAINPTGDHLFQRSDVPGLHTLSLHHSSLLEYRNSFPAWKDADSFPQESIINCNYSF